MYQVAIEQFEGPFDVLLQLIEKEQLDITHVSLARIADDFVFYVQEHDLGPQELVDFLSIAVRLLYLKSKQLIPQLYEEELESEQEDITSLQNQLRRYKAFVDASKLIETRIQESRYTYHFEGKRPQSKESVIEFIAPDPLTKEDLHVLYGQIVQNIRSFVIIPQATVLKIKSLKEVMGDIHEKLRRLKKLSFFEIVDAKGNKTDIIVHFLGILELAKQKQIEIEQSSAFHDIILKEQSYE